MKKALLLLLSLSLALPCYAGFWRGVRGAAISSQNFCETDGAAAVASTTTAATTSTTTSTTTVLLPSAIGTAFAWYRMDDVTTSGSDIIAVNDKIGTNDLEDGTHAGPNLNSTGLNSLPVAEFDDTNDELLGVAFSNVGSDIWYSVVVKAANNSELHCFASSDTIFQDYAVAIQTDYYGLQAANNFASWTDGTTATDTNWHHVLVKVEQSSGNHELYLDFSSTKEINNSLSGVADAQGFRIGACGGNSESATPADYAEVSIAEAAIWTSFSITNCTSDDCKSLKDYYCDRYGSTLTGCP